jgi:hypothetical protein
VAGRGLRAHTASDSVHRQLSLSLSLSLSHLSTGRAAISPNSCACAISSAVSSGGGARVGVVTVVVVVTVAPAAPAVVLSKAPPLRQVLLLHGRVFILHSTHVRCVSTFLDKNRRYIGKSQPKRPPKRTPRTPHRSTCRRSCRGSSPRRAAAHTPPHTTGRRRAVPAGRESGREGGQRRRGQGSVRARVEIMGSPKCRIVGKSQPVLIMIGPVIFTRISDKNRCGIGESQPTAAPGGLGGQTARVPSAARTGCPSSSAGTMSSGSARPSGAAARCVCARQ